MSIAGGYYKAVEAAASFEMDCVQIFTKNNNQWKGKTLTDKDEDLFRGAMAEHGMRAACAHASYLINMGSPDDELWQKSVDAYVIDPSIKTSDGQSTIIAHDTAAFTIWDPALENE